MTSANIHSQKILILDFGSQYTQLIARRVRELGVYCEIWDYAADADSFESFAPQGIIFSGSPESANRSESPRPPAYLYAAGVPILGICYGMQTMAEHFGGKVEASSKSEFGFAQVDVTASNRLLDGIEDRITDSGEPQLDVWMSHGDKVTAVPPDFKVIAATESAPISAMADESRSLYGIQFHPEVTHTLQGLRILERFVREICNCDALWTSANIIEDAIATIKARVGTDKVLLGLSGGVDSSVVAVLLHKAIGDQLTCVFVDNGLLRLNEGDQQEDERNRGQRGVDIHHAIIDPLAEVTRHQPHADRDDRTDQRGDYADDECKAQAANQLFTDADALEVATHRESPRLGAEEAPVPVSCRDGRQPVLVLVEPRLLPVLVVRVERQPPAGRLVRALEPRHRRTLRLDPG
ncbi:MAG: glutamine-hydrolyzing GMP synthase, partial [Proteobacteria bacterium]|nr:glutamine-hydrolyzing GMP synthase [Pseudomonadota bacterium]